VSRDSADCPGLSFAWSWWPISEQKIRRTVEERATGRVLQPTDN